MAEVEFDHNDDLDCPSLFQDMPTGVNFKKLRKRLIKQTRQAIDDFSMVKPGDKWLVCLSGGKDSYALLALLMDLKWRGLLPVELLATNLDQGQPGFPSHILPEFFEANDITYHIERRDTYSVVTSKIPENKTYCSLCSRLRRGHLYRVAREQGCQAIILGHHRDDIVETFFLNLFHGGRLAAMPPKLLNEDDDLFVMRPLAYCAESDLEKFAHGMQFPIIPCDLCGSQDGLQRQQIKAMLHGWEQQAPGRTQVIFKALTNSRPAHLLDRSLFDFANLSPQTESDEADACGAVSNLMESFQMP